MAFQTAWCAVCRLGGRPLRGRGLLGPPHTAPASFRMRGARFSSPCKGRWKSDSESCQIFKDRGSSRFLVVPGQGFEPQLTDSESVVLPVRRTRNNSTLDLTLHSRLTPSLTALESKHHTQLLSRYSSQSFKEIQILLMGVQGFHGGCGESRTRHPSG